MNRSALSSVVTVVVAGLVAFGVSRWTASASAGPSLDRLQNSDWLVRVLSLTPEQAAKLSALKKDYVESLGSCCERQCSTRARIGEELFRPGWTAEKQEKLAEQLCKAQRDTEIATLDHIRSVHNLLTPEQQKKYEGLVTSCLCSDCPSGMHSN